MAISTYTELVSAVKSWLHRGDLDARIPDFITLGEARINRMLDIGLMRASSIINPSTSVSYLALPSRFVAIESITDDLGNRLIELVPDALETKITVSSASRPAYYRITSRIDFDCVADAVYDYTISYTKGLDIETDTTNDILTYHPDIYLYATLVVSAPFIGDDARTSLWADLLRNAIQEASLLDRHHTIVMDSDLQSAGGYNIYTDWG